MNTMHTLAQEIHQIAAEHGFWDKERNLGEMLMLATSELAEALESHRNGEPPFWFKHEESCVHHPLNDLRDVWPSREGCSCRGGPKPEGVVVELIDCIIRCLDTSIGELEAFSRGHRLGGVILTIDQITRLKMAYNAQREHMHGKEY